MNRLPALLLAVLLLTAMDMRTQVPVPDEMRHCKEVKECAEVETLCSGCCGVEAIRDDQRKAYGALYAAKCEGYHGGVCDCAPRDGTVQCLKGKCTRVITERKK